MEKLLPSRIRTLVQYFTHLRDTRSHQSLRSATKTPLWTFESNQTRLVVCLFYSWSVRSGLFSSLPAGSPTRISHQDLTRRSAGSSPWDNFKSPCSGREHSPWFQTAGTVTVQQCGLCVYSDRRAVCLSVCLTVCLSVCLCVCLLLRLWKATLDRRTDLSKQNRSARPFSTIVSPCCVQLLGISTTDAWFPVNIYLVKMVQYDLLSTFSSVIEIERRKGGLLSGPLSVRP